MGLRLPSAASSGGGNLPATGGAPSNVAPITGHGGRGGGGQQQQLSPEVQRILAETSQQLQLSRSEMTELKRELSTQHQTLGRIRDVFSPVRTALDLRRQKTNQYGQMLDQVLEWGVDRERQGASAPMTVQLGSDFYTYAMEAAEREEKLLAKIEEMEKKLTQVMDPRQQINQIAYSQMDTFCQQALDMVYGPGPKFQTQKSYQFKAISAQIADEIKILMKDKPEIWDAISRDREKQRRMVTYFVEQNMPPAARNMIERQRVREEPQTLANLVEALREARETYANDPVALKSIVPKIRAEIAAEIMAKQKRGEAVDTRMGQMFR